MKKIWSKIVPAFLLVVIACGLLFIALRIGKILVPAIGKGPSMEPTIQSGERYWILKTMNYQRGDIVAVELEDGTRITKRIIGMPGDKSFSIGYSSVWIDGDWLNEPYLDYRNLGWNDFGIYDATLELGPDEYYIMGDNRKQSKDSRHFGPIKKEQILGKVIIK